MIDGFFRAFSLEAAGGLMSKIFNYTLHIDIWGLSMVYFVFSNLLCQLSKANWLNIHTNYHQLYQLLPLALLAHL